MDRKEFASFVKTVKQTYRTEKFIEDQGTFDTWYPYFEEYALNDLLTVFRDYAVSSRFTPQISDLIPKLKAMKTDRGNEIYNHYESLEFVWSGTVSMDCLEKFKSVCRGNVSWAKALVFKGKEKTKAEPELAMEDWLDEQERQVIAWMRNRQ